MNPAASDVNVARILSPFSSMTSMLRRISRRPSSIWPCMAFSAPRLRIAPASAVGFPFATAMISSQRRITSSTGAGP